MDWVAAQEPGKRFLLSEWKAKVAGQQGSRFVPENAVKVVQVLIFNGLLRMAE